MAPKVINKSPKIKIEKNDLKFSEIDKINSKIDKLRLNQGKILDKYLKDISLSDLNKFHYGIFSQFNEDSIILAMGSKDKNKFTVDMQTDLVEYLIKIIEVNLLNLK